MLVRDILRAKGDVVHAIVPDATLADVVQALVRHNVGSLVVCSGAPATARIVGVITERDVLRAQAADERCLDRLRVSDAMSHPPVTASPGDRIDTLMRVMTQRRVRHLPVVDGDRLLGIVSLGDVVKSLYDQAESDNCFIKSYLLGEGGETAVPPERIGAGAPGLPLQGISDISADRNRVVEQALITGEQPR